LASFVGLDFRVAPKQTVAENRTGTLQSDPLACFTKSGYKYAS